MTRDELHALNERNFAAWNAHDLAAISALSAPDGTSRDAPAPEALVGRDAISERHGGILAAFPDCRLEILSETIEGNRIATEWRFTGTHEGEFLGVPASGRAVENIGCTVTTINDAGLASDVTFYWDSARFFAQVGGTPAQGTPAAAGA